MCPASSASLLVESLQPTPKTPNTSTHINTKTYKLQNNTNMAPGRSTGAKMEGGGGKTSLGGTFKRGVGGKGLGMGKFSGAKRHR